MFMLSKRDTPQPARDFAPSLLPGAANSSRSSNDVQRELVRVAFKDTLRATGLPAQWLECEVNYLQTAQGEQVLVQLVMKRWSGHVLRYAQAFQHAMAQCLDRYEPHVDHSRHVWAWKFAPGCDVPFPILPPPEAWAEKLAASQGKPAAAEPRPAARHVAPQPAVHATQPSQVFALRDIFSDLTVDQLAHK